MKNVLIAIACIFFAYSALKRADAVQSIDFRGDNYELSDSYQRSGSGVYMYTPNGENFLRAGHYIQVAHLPKVDLPAEEFRRQYMETMGKAASFDRINENYFFYIEANSLVHGALVQEGDRFKLYGYAEILPDGAPQSPSSHRATPAIAQDLEKTIRNLPLPPRTISTWF